MSNGPVRDADPRSSRPVAEFRPPQFSETLLGLFVLWCAYLFSNRNGGFAVAVALTSTAFLLLRRRVLTARFYADGILVVRNWFSRETYSADDVVIVARSRPASYDLLSYRVRARSTGTSRRIPALFSVRLALFSPRPGRLERRIEQAANDCGFAVRHERASAFFPAD